VRLVESYLFFNLNSSEKISAFTKIIGQMSITGLRKQMPMLDNEHVCRLNDAVNMSNMDVFIGTIRLRVKVHALKQIVGKTAENDWLRAKLSAHPIGQQAVPTAGRTLCINSKFDNNYNIFKVIETSDTFGVRFVCIWGERKGQEVFFQDINEVINLVNIKRS
jgi:hypothetical protein